MTSSLRRSPALLLLAFSACGDSGAAREAADAAPGAPRGAASTPAQAGCGEAVASSPTRPVPGERPVAAQLGAFAEPARAAALRDSLIPGTSVVRVNRGSHGMAARVRWTTSPDRCALLVVEDPAAVEAEPVPDGFVLASERGPALVQRDSVWDVAPSPDWSRLVYGRAYVLLGRERDSIPRGEWEALAEHVGLGVDAVRRGAFVSSGMALAYGVARPIIADVASGGEHALATTGGWRVAWTRDGGAVVLGGAPSQAQDAAPPSRWEVIDAGTPAARSASERARSLGTDIARAEVAWTEGPTMDVSVVAPREGAPIAVERGTVESRDGWIRLRTAPAAGEAGRVRVVGPGVALAATRRGRFVAALVPDPERRDYEPPVRLVVYRLPD